MHECNSVCYDAFAVSTLPLHLKARFCYLHGQCAIVSFYDAYWNKRLRPSSCLCAIWVLPAHIAIPEKSAHTLCNLGFGFMKLKCRQGIAVFVFSAVHWFVVILMCVVRDARRLLQCSWPSRLRVLVCYRIIACPAYICVCTHEYVHLYVYMYTY